MTPRCRTILGFVSTGLAGATITLAMVWLLGMLTP